MRRERAALALAGGLVLALVGCASPDSEPTEPSPASTASPEPSPAETSPTSEAPLVDIEVDAAGTLDMPTELTAGAHVFRVSSAAPADVAVIRPQGGYTEEDLAGDFGPHESEEGQVAAAASLEEGTVSLGGTWSEPGTSWGFALALDAGEYWFVDMVREPGEAGDDDTLEVAEILTVTVSESDEVAPLPEPDAVASATDDRSWDVPETLPASGALLVQNETDMSHRLVLERVPDGEDPQEWLEQSRVGHRECPCTSPARASAGTEFLWLYELPPGDYVVLDQSISDLGYPQYNGVGATLVELTE